MSIEDYRDSIDLFYLNYEYYYCKSSLNDYIVIVKFLSLFYSFSPNMFNFISNYLLQNNIIHNSIKFEDFKHNILVERTNDFIYHIDNRIRKELYNELINNYNKDIYENLVLQIREYCAKNNDFKNRDLLIRANELYLLANINKEECLFLINCYKDLFAIDFHKFNWINHIEKELKKIEWI